MRRFMMYGVFVLIGMALLFSQPAKAQTNTLGLSSNDYKLLVSANSAPLNSFAFQYTAQFTIQGLETFAINMDVKGSGAVDKSARALDVSLTGPIQFGTLQNTVANTEIKWVGNALYFNPGDGWQVRQDASTFLAGLIRQIIAVNVTPAAVAKWDTSGVEGFGSTLTAWKVIDPGSFVTAQRLADDTIGNLPAAHFQINANLFALMQTDAFTNVVLAISRAQGTPLQAFDRRKVKDIVRMNSALFQDTKLSIDQYIGLDDKLIHGIVLNLNMPIDPSKHGFTDGPFTATAKVDMTLSNHNQPPKIAAPDGAKAVSTFSVPSEAALSPAGTGVTEYVYFETIGKKAVYQRAFDAQAGDHVTITVRGFGLDFSGIAKLLSPDGKTLAEDDGSTSQALGLSGVDPQISNFSITQTGSYSAQITEQDGAAGSFGLTITLKR